MGSVYAGSGAGDGVSTSGGEGDGAGGSNDGCGGDEFSAGGSGGWAGEAAGGRTAGAGGAVYSGGGGGEPRKVRLGKGQKKADWQSRGENLITAGLSKITVSFSPLLKTFTEAVWGSCMWQGAPELPCSRA